MRTALLSLVLLVATPLAAGESFSSLPAGTVKVDVMQAVTAPRAAELSAKLRREAQHDQERWATGLREGKSGLTAEEQTELERVRGDVTFTKANEAQVEFVHTPDGRVVISSEAIPELAGVVLDINQDAVDTPFGRTTEHADVTSGPWTGSQWTLDVPGELPGTGTTIKLALGRSTEDGRSILVYEAKQVIEGQMPRRAKSVIIF